MMRQVWAAIATAWAVMAVFVVLALSQRATLPATGTGVVMARSASGGLVPVATALPPALWLHPPAGPVARR